MKVLFMGTPDFSIACLKWLTEHTTLCGVVTQPDKPKGRGHKMMPPPVKEFAMERDIPVFQPETLKNEAFLPQLQELQPDLIVVVAYGQILPPYLLEYPKYGCINVHASLLPKWRGAAPLQWCVMAGDTVTGVTTMQMDEGLDTGDMLIKKELPITPEDTGGSIHDKLSVLGAQALAETVEQIDRLSPIPQDHASFTYAPMITKETCHIDWSKTGREICNQIRGLYPMPLSFFLHQEKTVKVGKAIPGTGKLKPGEIGEYEKQKGLPVGCGDGVVYLEQIKPEGKKMMSIHDFMLGNSFQTGEILK
ncbi:MAG: methionyl-tRNA formyltransferase [Ruminococcaceae bacterium]|nr:methionyl-tRNA formyltransferase [Oscillospiraceae bacterium]